MKRDETLPGGRYRLERPLGKSWLAVHAGTGSRMVLKPRASFEDPRVIQHLARLRHPALPRILDEVEFGETGVGGETGEASGSGEAGEAGKAGEAGETGEPGKAGKPEPYIACEFLEGTTFSEWLQRAGGRLTPDEVIQPLAEAARVLSFLHEQNEPVLLHLDLKPEHLVRLPGGHVGLIDFDCARLLPLDPVCRTTIRCTAGYAAPELMTGQPGPESDIYAFGVIMLVLLTGQRFRENTLPPLEPLCRHLPPALTSIIGDCINTSPERRFSSAAALACALERLAARRDLLRQTAVTAGPVAISDSAPGTSAGPAAGPGAGPSTGQAAVFPASSASGPAAGFSARSAAGSGAGPAADTATSVLSAALPVAAAIQPALPNKSNFANHLKQRWLTRPGNRKRGCPFPAGSTCRDQLVVVWDGAAFAADLARRLSRSGRETIIIDADLLNPRLDMLLGLEAPTASTQLDEAAGPGMHPGLDLALTALMRQTLLPEQFPELLQKTGSPHLKALTGSYQLRDYAFYDSRTLLNLYRLCRMHADTVIVNCSRFLHDSFTCLSLLAADLVLVPLQARPLEIREFNRYLDFMTAQYPFERRKARFIAVDHDPASHLSWGMADALCGGLLAGCIPRSAGESRQRQSRLRLPLRAGMADEMDQLLRRLGFLQANPARPGCAREMEGR